VKKTFILLLFFIGLQYIFSQELQSDTVTPVQHETADLTADQQREALLPEVSSADGTSSASIGPQVPSRVMPIQSFDKNLTVFFTPEVNRAYYFCWDISAIGAFVINENYFINAGLALGTAGKIFELKTFVTSSVAPLKGIPLVLGLAYNYNGLPAYKTNMQTLMPQVSYNGRIAGATLGPSLRLNTFFNDFA